MARTVDVEVTVKGGREFFNTHSFRKPSYYLVLALNGEKNRTICGEKGDKAPKWDQKFVFAADLDSILHIEVLCTHDRGEGGHAIGQTDINILKIERNKDVELAFHRKDKKSGEMITAGRITLYLKVAVSVTFAVQESKASLRSLHHLNQMDNVLKIMNTIEGRQLSPIWTRLILSLDTVASYAENISELDSRATVAVSAVAFMVQVLVKQIERDEKVEKLGVVMADLYTYIRDGIEMDKIKIYQKILDKVLTQTTECAYFIAEYRKVKLFAQRAVINIVSDADNIIAQFEASFGELKISLILGSSLQTAVVSYRILQTVENIESLIHINNLPHLKSVGWDSGRTCLRGTRQKLIDEIVQWVSSSGSVDQKSVKHIYVLAGPPGCGKSTVAHTIAEAFHEQKRLAASLFLQGHSGPINSQTVSSSIIYQLAGYNPVIKARIAEALKSDPSLTTADIGQQFRHLLVSVINSGGTKDEAALAMIGPTLIILDGLHDIPERREQDRILTAIANSSLQLPPNFRLLLISQIGDRVMDVVGRVSHHCHIRHITFDILGGEPIEEFMSTSLERLDSQIPELGEKHSLEELQQSLMERSMGVPTWIDTLFRFLFFCVNHKESCPGPCDTLQQILSTSLPLSKEDAMDNLYPVICSSLPYPTHLIKDFLFTFTYSRKALSLRGTHKFISWACRVHNIDAAGQSNCPILHAFQELGLVIEKGSTHNRKSRFVLSPVFADFLTNKKRCHGTALFVDPKEVHRIAVTRIKTMNDELAPYLRKASDYESLSSSGHHPPENLQHASLTWAFFLELCGVGFMASPSDYSLLLTAIEEFLGKNIINWTHCLAIMEEETTLDSKRVQEILLQRLENWLMHHLSSPSIPAFELRLYLLLADIRGIMSPRLTSTSLQKMKPASETSNEVYIPTFIDAGTVSDGSRRPRGRVNRPWTLDENSVVPRLICRQDALFKFERVPKHCFLLTTRLPSLPETKKDAKRKQVNFKISMRRESAPDGKVTQGILYLEAMIIREFQSGSQSLTEPSRPALVEREVDIDSYMQEALGSSHDFKSGKVIADTTPVPYKHSWRFDTINLPMDQWVFDQVTWTDEDNKPDSRSLFAPGNRIVLVATYHAYLLISGASDVVIYVGDSFVQLPCQIEIVYGA
ncbi:hypothetical protein CPC08DRAFT_816220 [Agrocybe pediades]|nr:hypothetical protein CPC08DRAFT_816220 [Agrocybe pediades]